MKLKNYYNILNITRKSNKDEIKLSYRKLAKLYHPDSNKTKEAEDLFKDITEAYTVLIDDNKRKTYERQSLRYNYGIDVNDVPLTNIKYEFKSGQNLFSDVLNSLLGFRKDKDEANKKDEIKQKPIKGDDVVSTLEVSLKEALLGTEKKIAVKGYKGGMQTFTVKVPIGIKNGEKIRLAALGKPGKNGGKNGDLIINVLIKKYNDFILKGIDLIKHITLTPACAVIGSKISFSLFDEYIEVDLPPYLNNKEEVKILGKGYISENNTRGDLIIKINIEFPNDISQREKELYMQLYKLEKKYR